MNDTHRWMVVWMLILSLAACTANAPAPEPTLTSGMAWVEEAVTFSFGANQLAGVLTLPNQTGPFPAIVLISGSANENSGLRSGISDPYMFDQAHNIAKSGFAVLRYDPPGVGRSTGDARFETLDDRVEEAVAGIDYLQTRTDIAPDRVGLWGVSQGGWVIEVAAADYPQEVAFLISVSGSGVSVADQQVWAVETQSRAAGLSAADISKAALFSRLLIDWQPSKPMHQVTNQEAAEDLDVGPWQDFMKLVYEPGDISPAESLQEGIRILETIQDEPWAKALYLKTLYLPQLRSIPPEMLAGLKAQSDKNLLIDPKDFLPRVTVPVLAFFGEDDVLVPAQKSAELYTQYLDQAGNQNYKIVVFPHADHGLSGATAEYWQTLSEWLRGLYEE